MNGEAQRTRARTPEIKVHKTERESGIHALGSRSTKSSPASSRGSTPERTNYNPNSTSPQHVKGTRAKFIRQNPRFINTPICQVLPAEGGTSVAECLGWKEEGKPANSHRQGGSTQSPTHDSTLHRDFRPPSPDTRPQPLQRFSPHKTANSSNLPFGRGSGGDDQRMKEKISFQHQYDCRAEPSQPDRGKLHGSFVWQPVSKSTSTATSAAPSLRNATDNPSRAKSTPA